MSFDTISVIGLGYIGLPTAAMFASRKKTVIGVDINQYAVDTINRGEIHIVEPDLDGIVQTAVSSGYLKACTEPEPADAFLIAVPTPFKTTENSIPIPDLSYIQSSIAGIAPVLKKGDLVILESTSPVGTTEKMAEWLSIERPDLSFPKFDMSNPDINIAHCPERVLPGKVVRELVENDRVIGGLTEKCSQRAIELYKTFVEGECVVTNARTAEMAKLTENSCRDVQIAFANELSMICETAGVDVWELISLANRHPRINILQPGPGVGGHCIAVDPWFLISSYPENTKLIKSARLVNENKTLWVLEQVHKMVNKILSEDRNLEIGEIELACFGLSFKANIDDLRESPALVIAQKLKEIGFRHVCFVEPNIKTLPHSLICDSTSLNDAERWNHADINLMLVDHDVFREERFSIDISKPYIDTRGVW